MNPNSTEEIKQNLTKEQTGVATFKKSYPIDFSLHDDDGSSVLYIDDASGGHNLYLEILNSSERNIELIKDKRWLGNYDASEEHHHFELRFRPGVLANSQAITLKEVKDWSIGNKQHSDDTISLYLLHKNEQTTINRNEKIVLTLQQVSASSKGGARGTQVKLKYKSLRYQGDREELLGNRLQTLSIINHRGKKNIPLHIGLIGSHTVLNDGKSSNKLKLRISNILKQSPISLIPRDRESHSKFIISFDCGSKNDEWALVDKEAANRIQLSVAGEEIPKEGGEGQSPEWIITTKKVELGVKKHIEITLNEIICLTPSGYANLYVRYENIPGYWDGQFIIPIEKAPILYNDESVNFWNKVAFNMDGHLVFIDDNQYDIGVINYFLVSSQTEKTSDKEGGFSKRHMYLLDEKGQNFLNLQEISGQSSIPKVFTNFGFSIPTGATIQGIIVKVKRCANNVRVVDRQIRLTTQGRILGENKAKFNLEWKNSSDWISYGNSTDLWRESWTPEKVNDTGFGVAIEGVYQHNTTAPYTVSPINIDDAEITVYYTKLGTPVNRDGRPRNGRFAGQLFAESIEVKKIKIGDTEITEKELNWLKVNAK